jgi:hypothetical protein
MAESESAFVRSVRFDGMSHVPGAVRDARGWGTQESLLAEVRKVIRLGSHGRCGPRLHARAYKEGSANERGRFRYAGAQKKENALDGRR